MKVIVWDVDDVLNDLMKRWFYDKWLVEHGDCLLKYDDLKDNPPNKILGISLEEYLESLDNFRRESYMSLTPNSELFRWFNLHGYKFRHIALTAAPLHISPIVAQWVFKHFGRWIRTIHIIPSRRSFDSFPVYERNKGEFFDWFGNVDLFIDDNPQNVDLALERGIRAILWPQPWNKADSSISEILLEINKILGADEL